MYMCICACVYIWRRVTTCLSGPCPHPCRRRIIFPHRAPGLHHGRLPGLPRGEVGPTDSSGGDRCALLPPSVYVLPSSVGLISKIICKSKMSYVCLCVVCGWVVPPTSLDDLAVGGRVSNSEAGIFGLAGERLKGWGKHGLSTIMKMPRTGPRLEWNRPGKIEIARDTENPQSCG